jgi:pimeloyl-ACP methyl ester carboxylesterase
MPVVHHRYASVAGHRLFFREAGDPAAPVLVLLHGFPTSSYMFRDLVPALADRYHVIAPDHLGFGLSDAPSVDDFDYTFDALTELTEGLLKSLAINRYAIYVQDYDAGFVESFWKTVRAYQDQQTSENESAVRQFLTLDATRWQYLTGVPDETLVNPETWHHDYALLSRPGNDKVQLKLLRDYASNSPMYPSVQEYFRSSRVPLLAVWGRGDEIFGPAGAEAFAGDLPDAEIHLLDGGHFLLESALDEVAGLIRAFLTKVHSAA